MRYLIQDTTSGKFWTGSGWSDHILEALDLPGSKARDEKAYLRDRMDLKLKLVRQEDNGGFGGAGRDDDE